MNIDKFKNKSILTIEPNSSLNIIDQMFLILLMKQKYSQYLASLHESLDKSISLYFDHINNPKYQTDVTFRKNLLVDKYKNKLHVYCYKHNNRIENLEYALQYIYDDDDILDKLNMFPYFRKYNNRDMYIERYLSLKFKIRISSSTTNIDNILKNYMKFQDIRKKNILVLLNWLTTSKNKNNNYSINGVSKMLNKFDFLFDEKLLFNDVSNFINIFYDCLQSISNIDKYHRYANLKIDNNLTVLSHSDHILIKLYVFNIFKLEFDNINQLLTYKYVDNISIQLLTDYLINNNLMGTFQKKIEKFIFNSM